MVTSPLLLWLERDAFLSEEAGCTTDTMYMESKLTMQQAARTISLQNNEAKKSIRDYFKVR